MASNTSASKESISNTAFKTLYVVNSHSALSFHSDLEGATKLKMIICYIGFSMGVA